jgi:2,3-bisphosphoglycerate-independent phosphoglycerate mutase
MKYVLLHGDGLAGGPRKELGGKSLLEAAATPNMDAVARHAETGIAVVPAEGPSITSGMVQMAALGYDPRKLYPGPAPLEAASLGVTVGEHDVVYRCSMVTLRGSAPASPPASRPESRGTPGGAPASTPGGAQGQDAYRDIKKLAAPVTVEGEAEHLEREEARDLLEAVNEQLGSETIQFYPGSGSRHLMVWVGGKLRAVCLDPREGVGRPVGDCLPTGDGSDMLRKLMDASLVILRDHPVNDQRRADGLKPIHCLWLWGQGRATRWPSFPERYRVSGSVVATNDVRRGIGVFAGLEAVEPSDVAAADGSDFPSRGRVALRELGKKDFVYVHAEMPSGLAGGDPKAAVKIVEEFDKQIVGPLLDGLAKMGPHRLLLVCDGGRVPNDGSHPPIYALGGGPFQKSKSGSRRFNETEAAAVKDGARDATRLAAKLFAQG